jgi:hypothetical protein
VTVSIRLDHRHHAAGRRPAGELPHPLEIPAKSWQRDFNPGGTKKGVRVHGRLLDPFGCLLLRVFRGRGRILEADKRL